MRRSSRKGSVAAAFVAALVLATGSGQAAAGPALCVGTASVAAAGWLAYGLFKLFTAPVTVWTTPAEIAPLVAAGGATVEAVTAACAAPTP